MFLRWGPDYQQWHDAHWSPDAHPCVTVNTGSTLQRFLNEPNRWAIAPMSIVHQMSHDTRLTHYRLTAPPPPRICYEITNRHHTMAQQRAIDLFNEELRDFISESFDGAHIIRIGEALHQQGFVLALNEAGRQCANPQSRHI